MQQREAPSRASDPWGGVAQSVEQRFHKPRVVGSSPTVATKVRSHSARLRLAARGLSASRSGRLLERHYARLLPARVALGSRRGRRRTSARTPRSARCQRFDSTRASQRVARNSFRLTPGAVETRAAAQRRDAWLAAPPRCARRGACSSRSEGASTAPELRHPPIGELRNRAPRRHAGAGAGGPGGVAAEARSEARLAHATEPRCAARALERARTPRVLLHRRRMPRGRGPESRPPGPPTPAPPPRRFECSTRSAPRRTFSAALSGAVPRHVLYLGPRAEDHRDPVVQRAGNHVEQSLLARRPRAARALQHERHRIAFVH